MFDQLNLGGSWLNERIISLVWRPDIVPPALPQVILMETEVNADLYPEYIEVAQESTALTLFGRDEIIDWVDSGTPRRLKPAVASAVP